MSAAAETTGPRQRILAAALRLCADKGFECVTLRAVAACVGLHNSSLFHHFGSKAEIVAEVFEGVLERLLAKLAPLEQDDPPELDHFVGVLCDVVDHLARQPDDARFLLRAVIDPDAFLDAYTARVRRGEDENPVVRLFSLVWGWMDRAAGCRVIREVDVYQATRNLFGVLLFDPAYSLLGGVPGMKGPSKDDMRRNRLREVEAFVRGALAPEVGARP